MKNIKSDIYSKFIIPQGKLMRTVDSIFIFLAGVTCLFSSYFIKFVLCENDVCKKLEFTKLWANASLLYIVFGVSLIAVSIFIFKTKELPKIYGITITLVSLIGFMFCVSLVFAISREIHTIT